MKMHRLARKGLGAGVVLLALLCLTGRPALAQTAPLTTPVTATVYLPQVSTFHVTQPIAAGGAHSCAILPTGIVRCWGANDKGQLGDGTTISSTLPVTVHGLPAAIAVAAGYMRTCAATIGGLHCWGEGYGAAPAPVDGVANAERLGFYPERFGWNRTQTCAISTDHEVFCWQAPNPSPQREWALSGALTFAPGAPTLCVLVAGGTVRCRDYEVFPGTWGAFIWPGVSGALAAASVNWCEDTTCGFDHCFVDAHAEVACWRNGCSRSVGCWAAPQPPDRPVTLAAGARALVAGWDGFGSTFCALRSDGQVVCWQNHINAGPTGGPIAGLDGVIALDAGPNHACALHAGGAVSCWGANDDGQLGDGTTTSRTTPVRVVGLQP